ncbi:hypothetical protein MLD38_031887 [Melastoma candidum]|uniref:Uncharacterized protein n=1 Tax=Melastoma candidum TaxID=119954 RepID=A0ACB9MT00_9MYRT|nr:hypothetical protein MLD38_031887 [Melastoma candidum]
MRGEIDSCNHYFCFVCIMEWAKVKSCYPACKRRFKKIVRPNNGGDFASERVVRVLARDQTRDAVYVEECKMNAISCFATSVTAPLTRIVRAWGILSHPAIGSAATAPFYDASTRA